MAQTIQDPGVGAALQRLFGLQGRVRPALEEFVVPTVQLADLSLGAPPPLIRHASCRTSIAAVAGERPVFRFESVGGMICVIRRIFLFSATGASNPSFAFRGNAATLGALGTVATKSFTDGRLLPGTPWGAQQPSGVLTIGTQAGSIGTVHWEARMEAVGGLEIVPRGGWVVGTGRPGLVGFLEGQVATNNIALALSMEWDEFFLS